MAATLPAPPKLPARRCSGPIWPISAPSRRPTARPCRSAASRPSSTSTSPATSQEGALDESGAQELIDQLVQKLRIVRFLRTPEYDALFSGDPYWATECVGGMDLDGRTARHAHQLSHAAHADHAWPGARAQHHRALVPPTAGCLQALLPQGQPRHLLAAIRERRPDAAPLGRRLRHRLLRLCHAARQADAVLWRAGESRQGTALRHQRRPRRDQRRRRSPRLRCP